MKEMRTAEIDHFLADRHNSGRLAVCFGKGHCFTGRVRSFLPRRRIVFEGGERLEKRCIVGSAESWFFGSRGSEHWEMVRAIGPTQKSLTADLTEEMTLLAISAILASIKMGDAIVVGYGPDFLSARLVVTELIYKDHGLNRNLVKMHLSDCSLLFRQFLDYRLPWRFQVSREGISSRVWAVKLVGTALKKIDER